MEYPPKISNGVNQQEEKIQATGSDEIDLMDYLKVMIKRKQLIVVVFLVMIITAGAFSFLMPKVYKIDTVLEVGGIDGGSIEDPVQIVGKIQGDTYGIPVREKLGISEGEYPKIKTENPKDTNLVAIEVKSSKPQLAKTILEEINNLILERHQERVRAKKELIEHNIKTTEAKIHLVESDIEKTRNKIQPIESDIKRLENKINYTEEEKKNLEAKVEALEKVLVYEQTPGTQFALFDAKEKFAGKKQEIENLFLSINSLKKGREDLNIQINALEGEIESLKAQINSFITSLDGVKITKIVKKSTISEKPISPRPVLNIAIAGILGIFLGIFLAFGKEWWEKNKLKI